HLLSSRDALGDPDVLDDVLGSLDHHAASFVKALSTGAASDLLKVAHAEQRDFFAVELAKLREKNGSDGNVDAHSERIGAADHLEQTRLGELLHPEAVARQKSGVMKAQAVSQQLVQLFAIGRVEAGVVQRLADLFLLLGTGEVDAQQVLRLLRGGALGGGDLVNWVFPCREQVLERLVERRFPVLEIERHRSLGAADHRDLASGELAQAVLDRAHVAQGGGHQQERASVEGQQGQLPGHATFLVRVV